LQAIVASKPVALQAFEKSRLQIVCCLKSGAKNVTEIIEVTDLGQANVSKHLKILTQTRIVGRDRFFLSTDIAMRELAGI
jgi:DNA-binding transcriptional ArsR family regulator